MPGPPTLSEATVQEIQLELIRRRRFNQFDGQKVYESLLRHRDLWISVLMTTPQMVVSENKMPFLCLVPLRDMRVNHWNVDTMFLLCESQILAQRLREVVGQDDWQFDAEEILTGKTAEAALGMGPFEGAVLELWWD